MFNEYQGRDSRTHKSPVADERRAIVLPQRARGTETRRLPRVSAKISASCTPIDFYFKENSEISVNFCESVLPSRIFNFASDKFLAQRRNEISARGTVRDFRRGLVDLSTSRSGRDVEKFRKLRRGTYRPQGEEVSDGSSLLLPLRSPSRERIEWHSFPRG